MSAMIFILKLIFCVLLWVVVHKICMGFPYKFLESTFKNGEPEPYDYFQFYAVIYMITFIIIFLIW